MKTHYFTVTDEDGRTAGIIKATNNREFESALMDCTREHHVLVDVELKNSLLINDYIGEDKTVTVKGIIDEDEEPVYYYIRLESCLVYGESRDFYQVLNLSGNPASTETNPEALFFTKEQADEHIEFLENVCGLDPLEFSITELQ